MNVLDYLKEHIVYLDGGMGTLLQAEGLQPGEEPERWNLTQPEVIIRLQKAYFDAGTNIINTNTFGANLLHFSKEEFGGDHTGCHCQCQSGGSSQQRQAGKIRGSGYWPQRQIIKALRRF